MGSARVAVRARWSIHAFDLLHLDGWDLLEVPLEERKRLLRTGAARASRGALRQPRGRARRGRSRRRSRSRAWRAAGQAAPEPLRARCAFAIVAQGEGAPRAGAGRRSATSPARAATRTWARCWWPRTRPTAGASPATSAAASTHATRKRLRELIDADLAREDAPVPGTPPSPTARYCEPRHVVRAEFAEWTPDGLLRQAAYKGLEMGRDPLTVSREVVQRTTEVTGVAATRHRGSEPVACAASDAAGRRVAGGARRARCARRRWALGRGRARGRAHQPRQGALPRGRLHQARPGPLLHDGGAGHPALPARAPAQRASLARRGRRRKTQFWQKQIPEHAPDWVARWDYPDAGRSQSHTYVVADRVATMAWLANQACIDLHPWTSRLPTYWRPTYALIDIDPGTETTWAGGGDPGTAVPDRARSSRRARLPQGHRQARHPGLDPRRSRATPSMRHATGSAGSRAASGRWCLTWCPGSGARPTAGGGPDSTTPRTR